MLNVCHLCNFALSQNGVRWPANFNWELCRISPSRLPDHISRKLASATNMAERELYGNRSATDFPFNLVPRKDRSTLARFLQKFDEQDTSKPHANFATAINSTLVWTGARTASLPSSHCNKKRVDAFIGYLNKVSRRIET